MTATAHLRALIAEAECWQVTHRRAGRQIDATLAAVRARALRDALKVVEAEHG